MDTPFNLGTPRMHPNPIAAAGPNPKRMYRLRLKTKLKCAMLGKDGLDAPADLSRACVYPVFTATTADDSALNTSVSNHGL
ncbi:uncharacterized protein AMSG_11276 [Thecamonas trahens ATCC 50062]|uniref:Uncharacterized protein n=1 Tax=Thecamonas trahens ATCC 50062 TaxID=461836 RepID=A0A0L0DU89_THETB|nr:hypothetical protein AMSG_11276 [Thecamonas trahens ATCC 50062]KNC55835.1 hypothetical protein AMSG_11276 [Thecamonas trahens ATCC 50062]|eukprot:XP_013752812.1 hypothetical protein AMSG_11276 [Thecamonas trahens ATCC 50062]